MHVFDRRSHIFRIQTASEDNRNFGVAHDNLPADRPIVCLSGASNLISCYVDAVQNETVHQLLEGFRIGDTVGRNDIDGLEHLHVGKPTPQAFHRAGSNFAVKLDGREDRKSTRLNSSHRTISYAVFCLKKKKYKSLRLLLKKTKIHIQIY